MHWGRLRGLFLIIVIFTAIVCLPAHTFEYFKRIDNFYAAFLYHYSQSLSLVTPTPLPMKYDTFWSPGDIQPRQVIGLIVLGVMSDMDILYIYLCVILVTNFLSSVYCIAMTKMSYMFLSRNGSISDTGSYGSSVSRCRWQGTIIGLEASCNAAKQAYEGHTCTRV